MTMIAILNKDTNFKTITDRLLADGGVIVANLTDSDLVDKVAKELRPHFDQQGDKFSNDFNGYKTLRLSGILGISQTSAELIAHPLVMAVADHILKRHCDNYPNG
jgi:hypothetical protein